MELVLLKDVPTDYLKQVFPDTIDPDGNKKTYVPAKKYLRQEHKKPSSPLYRNDMKNFMMLGSRGFGKALKNNELLYTETGTKPIGEAQVGDKIYGADGKLTTITNVYPQGEVKLLKFTFRDGREITCCPEHLWTMRVGKKLVTLPAKDIAKKYYNPRVVGGKCTKDKEFIYFLPKSQPLQFPEKNLPLDPYTLGILIGDGSTTANISYTSNDPEIKDYIPYNVTKHKSPYVYGVTGINHIIKELNLKCKAEHKFIPEEYKQSSIEQRFELLRGLMDTDGSIDKSGSVEFSTSSEKLKEDVMFLLRSLGIMC